MRFERLSYGAVASIIPHRTVSLGIVRSFHAVRSHSFHTWSAFASRVLRPDYYASAGFMVFSAGAGSSAAQWLQRVAPSFTSSKQ